jgi:FkbM family methyltransferase
MFFKRLASHLPFAARQMLRAAKYRVEFAAGRFRSDEPEFQRLAEWVQPGDWVLDIGANVGQYTLRLSELVGPQGRVIAFEPIAETVEILAAMARRARHRNITLLNVAVSECAGEVRLRVPANLDGLPDYFQSRVAGDGDQPALAVALDGFHFPHRIALVKIDVERHEVSVIRGMLKLIERDRPTLIVEGHEGIYPEFLQAFGYRFLPKAPGSPNLVFQWDRTPGLSK